MSIDYTRLGKRIALRRRELGYRQSWVEEQANLSYKYLSSIETGRSIPSLETLMRISEALGVTPDYLLLGTISPVEFPAEDTLPELFNRLMPKEQELVKNFAVWLLEQNI